MCENLDPTTNPFNEDFPNYDNNTDIIPLNFAIYIGISVYNQMVEIGKNIIKESINLFLDSIEKVKYDYNVSNEILNNTLAHVSQVSELTSTTYFNENFLAFLSHSSEAFKALANFSQDYPVIRFITIGFLFYKVVKTYGCLRPLVAYLTSIVRSLKYDTSILKYHNARRFSIRNFAVTKATIGAFLLYGGLQPFTWEYLQKTYNKNKEGSLLLFSKLKKKRVVIHRNLSNKNNIPPIKDNYFLLTLMFLIVFYVLISISDLIGMKNLIFLYLIFGFIYLLYLIANLCLFIYIIQNKITTPNYLPDFIRSVFLEKEDIVKSGDEIIKLFLHLDVVVLLSHSLTYLLGLIVYILI